MSETPVTTARSTRQPIHLGWLFASFVPAVAAFAVQGRQGEKQNHLEGFESILLNYIVVPLPLIYFSTLNAYRLWSKVRNGNLPHINGASKRVGAGLAALLILAAACNSVTIAAESVFDVFKDAPSRIVCLCCAFLSSVTTNTNAGLLPFYATVEKVAKKKSDSGYGAVDQDLERADSLTSVGNGEESALPAAVAGGEPIGCKKGLLIGFNLILAVFASLYYFTSGSKTECWIMEHHLGDSPDVCKEIDWRYALSVGSPSFLVNTAVNFNTAFMLVKEISHLLKTARKSPCRAVGSAVFGSIITGLYLYYNYNLNKDNALSGKYENAQAFLSMLVFPLIAYSALKAAEQFCDVVLDSPCRKLPADDGEGDRLVSDQGLTA